jgi:hypothetical protein
VLILAAILSIPAAVATVVYVLGIFTTLKFDWLHAYAPYIHSCIAFAVLLWLTIFVVDYFQIRHAALMKSPAVDVEALLAAIRTERDRSIAEERTERDRLIDCANHKIDTWVERTNEALNRLTSKPTPELAPEPTLKQRTMQLHDRLRVFAQEYEKRADIQQERDESNDDFVVRRLKDAMQESVQMSADFRIQFQNDMRTLNDQIELRSGLPFLAATIAQAARACNPKSIEGMREQLWECARTMEK